jgi:hypothetical protein
VGGTRLFVFALRHYRLRDWGGERPQKVCYPIHGRHWTSFFLIVDVCAFVKIRICGAVQGSRGSVPDFVHGVLDCRFLEFDDPEKLIFGRQQGLIQEKGS